MYSKEFYTNNPALINYTALNTQPYYARNVV